MTNVHGLFCSNFDEKMIKKPHFLFKPADSKYFSGLQSISVAASAAMSENFGFRPPMTQKSLFLPDQESRILPRVRERLTNNQDQELESCKSRILETLNRTGGRGVLAEKRKMLLHHSRKGLKSDLTQEFLPLEK